MNIALGNYEVNIPREQSDSSSSLLLGYKIHINHRATKPWLAAEERLARPNNRGRSSAFGC